MKPRLNSFFPRTLFLCCAPFLACASAQASLVNFNEQNVGNNWTLPPGTNLLAGATITPAAPSQHEGSNPGWSVLFNGQLGAPAENIQSVTPINGEIVTFALDLTGFGPGVGHNITSFDSYCAWGNSGRDNQNYTIAYSTAADPTNFLPLATVSNQSGNPVNSTHSSLSDTTGFLAMNVHSIRITFGTQENGYTGFREFILRSGPVINTLTESNTTNAWALPPGANLLNAANANSPGAPDGYDHGNGDVSSFTWGTLTDGTVGVAGTKTDSVSPNNNTSVIFPLDTSVNVNGYNISSFDSYSAWPNGGRDDQQYAIRYSTVANPTVFLPLANVDIRTPLLGADLATHARLTRASGFLATGVAALQFYFNNQENGYVGYREFVALGSAVPLSEPLTWKGSTGSWVNAADGNWKKTSDGTAASFNPLAPVTFDTSGITRNVTVGSGITTASVSIANDGATAYTFGGSPLTITNDLVSSGSGDATFANGVSTIGVMQSGSGSLVFNGPLSTSSLGLSGTGAIALNVSNPDLTGTLSVASGTLTVGHNTAAEFARLSMSGGSALFTTTQPVIASLGGLSGSVLLGKTVGAVNTNLSVGDANGVTTVFAGSIGNAAGVVGRITKTGGSNLVLAGTNSYTGPTRVESGLLVFATKNSLYGGNSASWSSTNLLVEAGATMGFKAGGSGEFLEADLGLISLGGFGEDAIFGVESTANVTLSRNLTQPGLILAKSGSAILTLTGNNTAGGTYQLHAGTINAANPTGHSIPANIVLGNNTAKTFLNMGADNQFGPDSVLVMSPGDGSFETKMNLRGTTQTLAGLESFGQGISLIQNDEIGQPGYTSSPGPASLVIDAESNHTFRGLIRNENGGVLSLTKNGPGVQELVNHPVQSYGYTGPTTINEGTLKLNFAAASSGFGSNISIASGALLELGASAGNWALDRVISGVGPVRVTGTNAVVLTNGNNSWSGGTVVDGGFLALSTNIPPGAGDGPGQTCVGGAMIPSNVIEVNNGTLSLDNTAALGESTMLPEFALSIRINPTSKLFGGTNSVVFVPNLTLDGGLVQVSGGAPTGGFNTNICFVGTVVVGGVSTNPSLIETTGTGPNSNASLGSIALPGTVFQVADVTGDALEDLTVSSLLRDVSSTPSPLTKTGPGTMSLVGPKSYTGATNVVAGELRADTAYLDDSAPVSIDSGAFLNLTFSGTDTVAILTLAGVQVPAGVYGSTSNNTPGVIQTPRITGGGTLTVISGPSSDPYAAYISVVTNPADRDKTDDPDGDGFTNLQEYLLGGSPIVPTGSLTRIEKAGSGIIVRWDQRNSGGTYTLQESGTLADPWSTSPAVITNAVDQSNRYSTDYTRKEATIPIDAARKFARVRAVINP